MPLGSQLNGAGADHIPSAGSAAWPEVDSHLPGSWVGVDHSLFIAGGADCRPVFRGLLLRQEYAESINSETY